MRRLGALAAPALLTGCISMSLPRPVQVSALIPAPVASDARDPLLSLSVERFIDERPERSVLGYALSGLGGPTPIAAEGDLTAAVERYVAEAFERKGAVRGRSPLALRGVIQRASVGTMPLNRTWQASAAFQLTIVDTGSRARLWARSYSGNSTAADPQGALAAAFREAFGALEADESMLGVRDAFLAAGGQVPAAAARASAPAAQAFSSDVDEPGGKVVPRPDDYALVVGIERYQSIPEAQFGERDAATFRRYAVERLGVPEENVVSLLGSKATRGGLARYLEEWLPKNVTEKSRLWVYYSGHGAPDPVKGSAYLIPWDGDPAFLESSAYPLSGLYERLAALKAKSIVVVLDACFSGAGGRSVLAKGARPLVMVKGSSIPEDPRLAVLTASAGDQITGALQEQAHGMFSYYLLRGLKGAADADKDGHVTLAELSAYLSQEVPRAARRQNREQTPQSRASDLSLRLY